MAEPLAVFAFKGDEEIDLLPDLIVAVDGLIGRLNLLITNKDNVVDTDRPVFRRQLHAATLLKEKLEQGQVIR